MVDEILFADVDDMQRPRLAPEDFTRHCLADGTRAADHQPGDDDDGREHRHARQLDDRGIAPGLLRKRVAAADGLRDFEGLTGDIQAEQGAHAELGMDELAFSILRKPVVRYWILVSTT